MSEHAATTTGADVAAERSDGDLVVGGELERQQRRRRVAGPVVIVRSSPPTMRSSVRSAWMQRELLWSLALRDLRTRYRRSVLGWGWSLVNPLVQTLVYAFVFKVFFHAEPAPGSPSGQHLFAVFLLAALLPWQVFNTGVPQAIGALIGGSSMMGKVNFAREHLVLGSIIATVVSFCVEGLVLAGFVTALGYSVLRLLPVLVFLTALLGLYAAGFALWLSALNVRYRDVQHLVGVAFLVLFYLTPVIYGPDRIPAHRMMFGVDVPLRSLMMVNPLARFTEAYRNCYYDVRLPGLGAMAYLVVASFASLLLGYRFFTRRSARFIEDM